MSATELLKKLLESAQKAANIARGIRSDPQLLARLTEEKDCKDKNQRFAQDFKTLADVLIQELIKHELSQFNPQLSTKVFGEENGLIETSVGQVSIKIGENNTETELVLLKALEGDSETAKALSKLIHQKSEVDFDQLGLKLTQDDHIDIDDIGFWIDPIDGTNVYIKSERNQPVSDGDIIVKSGLENVTILIGAFSLSTKLPLLGIIYQPFINSTSKLYWAFGQASNIRPPPRRHDEMKQVRVVISSAEPLANKLQDKDNLQVHTASGAGYKLLCVVQGLVDIYFCSMPTTFHYDTLAPHALLKAFNPIGVLNWNKVQQKIKDILNEDDEVSKQALVQCELHYNPKSDHASSDEYCNSDGLLAYADVEKLKHFLRYLTPS